MTDTDRLAELAAKATPGPWVYGGHVYTGDGQHRMLARTMNNPDAEFIVALVNSYPSLVAAARERDELRAALTHIQGEGCDSAAFYGLPMPAWDTCLDYEYREERPTGEPLVDRCLGCVARAALHRGDGA